MNPDYDKFVQAFKEGNYSFLSSAYFNDDKVAILACEKKSFLTFLIINGFCDGTSCYEMPAVALMLYRSEIVGESLDDFLYKIVQLGDLASCICMNDGESHLTKLWISVPKIKQWMRRENDPPLDDEIGPMEIKSDEDLQAAFGSDE